MTFIGLGLDKAINILNIMKCVSVWWWLHINNTEGTLEAQFMKNLSNTEAELKQSVTYRKKCICNFEGWYYEIKLWEIQVHQN